MVGPVRHFDSLEAADAAEIEEDPARPGAADRSRFRTTGQSLSGCRPARICARLSNYSTQERVEYLVVGGLTVVSSDEPGSRSS